jgi:hypothetical protein
MYTPRSVRRRWLLALGLALLLAGGWYCVGETSAAPKGQMVLAVDFSIAPAWFDPGETPAIGTPYIFLYGPPGASDPICSALHICSIATQRPSLRQRAVSTRSVSSVHVNGTR